MKKLRIACVGHRVWALQIYRNLQKQTEHQVGLVCVAPDTLVPRLLEKYNPDYVLFYGWSWKVPTEIVEKYKCVMLHPSPLPEYRGGSPLQNQIINGVKKTKVTLFVMNSEMDAGDIIGQKDMSLDGHMCDIFRNLTDVGTELSIETFNKDIVRQQQDQSKATVYKRRTPEQSEITLEEIVNKTGKHLYNKIRMLEDPYPNAYIRTADGKKLIIKLAELEE